MVQISRRKCDGSVAEYSDFDLLGCATQALFNGMLYFAFRVKDGTCQVPNDDDFDQCITNDRRGVNYEIFLVQCPPMFSPTIDPTSLPTVCPSKIPTKGPSTDPTLCPSKLPSTFPSFEPSQIPSQNPTVMPSQEPSNSPNANPTDVPI